MNAGPGVGNNVFRHSGPVKFLIRGKQFTPSAVLAQLRGGELSLPWEFLDKFFQLDAKSYLKKLGWCQIYQRLITFRRSLLKLHHIIWNNFPARFGANIDMLANVHIRVTIYAAKGKLIDTAIVNSA